MAQTEPVARSSPAVPATMSAAVRTEYGGPSRVSLERVAVPKPGPKDVLVRVRAVSLNASDWEHLTGRPAYVRIFGLRRPHFSILGSDVAGDVVAVGERVAGAQRGDAVMADAMGAWGALAEYVALPAEALVPKPPELSYEQAASIPQAAAIAVRGVEQQRLDSSHRVLIVGGGGGSGSLAIQLAKRAGAHVTAVDNGLKQEYMRSLGADRVVDYAKEDLAQGGARWDYILDLFATRSLARNARLLGPRGRYRLVGGQMSPLLQTVFFGGLYGLFAGKQLRLLTAPASPPAAARVARALVRGQLQLPIDRVYPLDRVREALSYHGEGHALGKVVVRID